VKAIALGKWLPEVGREGWHGGTQRIRQAQADHPACSFVRGHGQIHVAARALDGRHDGRGGIHQRAIPVENHQRITHRFLPLGEVACPAGRSCPSSRSQAGGRDALSASGSLVSGCAISSECACRNIRRKSYWREKVSRTASLPYLSSPTIGKPLAARCTRIWWVRPVRSSAS